MDAATFLESLSKGRLDDVKKQLAKDPELVHVRDPHAFGATTLNQAVVRRNLALIDLLLDHGADPNQKSDWWAGGFGPLHSLPRDSIVLEDGLGDATSGGPIARRLIERGCEVDVHAAAWLGMLSTLRAILDRDPALIEAPGGDGQRPLHFAASVPIARELVDRGADIHARDVDHESTPAQWAASDRPAMTRYLVERGAEADLFMAAAAGDTEMVESELAREPKGAHLRLTRERFPCGEAPAAGHIYMFAFGKNTTPLHAAAVRGRAEAALTLLDAGADPTARGGYDDSTPLHIAAWNGNVEVLRVLLEAGAEIDVLSGPIHTNSPMGWAIVSGAAEIVDLCMERGAEIQSFHVEDADAGRRGEFLHWTGASQDARVQIAKKVRT